MSPGRRRHQRQRQRSPLLRAAVVVAPLATLAAVGMGMAEGDLTDTTAARSTIPSSLGTVSVAGAHARAVPVSRSADRMAQGATAGISTLHKDPQFATDDLDLRVAPRERSAVLREVPAGSKLITTGVISGDFAQVLVGQDYRWVTAAYLSQDKPADPETMGLSDAPCPDGSVEHNLTSGAVRVYRAVCHNFPQVTRYGGWANRGEHSSGKAIDIMTSDVRLGTDIAAFLRAHASALNLFDVIWRQHIWTPVRAGEGWRSMPNRGSATANHYDHVHVSVN